MGRRRNAAFSLIELSIALSVIAIISVIALPNLVRARKAANESRAIGNLRAIFQNQAERGLDGVPDRSTLDGVSHPVSDDVIVGGYEYFAKHEATWTALGFPFDSTSGYTWGVLAVPVDNQGDRSFWIDARGAIRLDGSPSGSVLE